MMVAVVASLLFLAVLVFATVRFAQWLRGTGPFARGAADAGRVSEQRRALRDEIARGGGQHEDPPHGTADLNDAWMAGEAFDPPNAGSDDRRR
jgi:hypothetical protein